MVIHTSRRECDAILFDFDGTLAPNLDLPGMRREVVDYTRRCGVPDAVIADCYILANCLALMSEDGSERLVIRSAEFSLFKAHPSVSLHGPGFG